jgi:exonuclease SbcD
MALSILLTSDLHLGMKFARYPEAQAVLVEARFACLERIVAAANGAGCDLLVVAGDLFESVSAALRDVQRAAATLAGFHGKLVAVMPGNHDYMSPDDRLWPRFKEAAGDTMLLLDQPRPYPLHAYDLDACLYPGPCTAKHSDRNAIGWVREAEKESTARHRIGIAHGSLEGFSPDMDGRYYPMRPAELIDTGMGLWLLGHTHARFPATPGARDRIFCAGTPEPDGFDCTHEGSAWTLTLQDSGAVSARPVTTGSHRFLDEARDIGTTDDLGQIERQYTGPGSETTLLRLRLRGRAPREVIFSVGALRSRLSRSLLHLDLRTDELREEITAEAIDRDYPAGSFPHSLLTRLSREGDQEGMQIAHELMREMRA